MVPPIDGFSLRWNFLILFILLVQLHVDASVVTSIQKVRQAAKAGGTRSFAVSYAQNCFLKDGQPFRYVSGSMHYFRVPRTYWRDRLHKMYAAGLDAVQLYVAWNVHEPSPGRYEFSGDADIEAFLKVAQDEGLLVILRAGPYVCGEWDFGGFPAWLLKDTPKINLRTMDPAYIKPVDRWMSVLLPKLKPHLYVNGGPIIMVQIENEYGSFPVCDKDYLHHLDETFHRYLGNDTVFFTTDVAADSYLKCLVDNAYATVDFGPGNATAAFESQRKVRHNGPLVNSEYYDGWLDYWGGAHAHYSSESVVKTFSEMIKLKANVNFYMFTGGTNFAYWNGADPPFNVCPTSYDYDAPISEAGDITNKYLAIRQVIGQYKKLPPLPKNTTKYAYGKVAMQLSGSVLSLLDVFTTSLTNSSYPLSMEDVGQRFGFIMYSTTVAMTTDDLLDVSGLRDRAWIYLDKEPVCLLDRNSITKCLLIANQGQQLHILVENQGRINYGGQINDNRKGLTSNVTLAGQILKDWKILSLDFSLIFNKTAMLSHQPISQSSAPPAVYMGYFDIPHNLKEPCDTFLKTDGWFKGQAFVNGFNLGRYWPVRGPQKTLYVPASVLKPQHNILVLVELERTPCQLPSCVNQVEFVDMPILG